MHFVGMFLALGWPAELAAQRTAPQHRLYFLYTPMFLITITSSGSFVCMETQVVPQINTIKPSGQLLYLYSTPITLLIKGNNHQNTFQVACECVWVNKQGRKGSLSILTSSYVRLFLIHSTLPTNLFCFPLQLMVQTLTQKGEDYRKSGKTKLITRGISTSQCCLKCNYMGLELWLRPGWLQISHWQTCSKIGLLLKMTAGEKPGVMTLSSTLEKVKGNRGKVHFTKEN